MSLPVVRRRCLAVLGSLALLTACGSGDGGESGPDAGPPTVEIGTGTRSFESLAEGDTLEVIFGPQGGYHFLGSVRATNINPGDSESLLSEDNPRTLFEVFDGETRVDAQASDYTQGLELTDEGAVMVGRRVILDIESDAELDGKMLRFLVTVEDVDGVVVSDERTVLAVPHPNN